MKPPLVRLLVAGTLLLGGVMIPAAPAAADGQIFAIVTLTNNTNTPISIPFSGASTPSAWGTKGNTLQDYPNYEVMPDGTPPRILAPGQTMLWGTKSNGGFLATSGTGGTLSIPLHDQNQTATMTWSVPWSYFNGGFPPEDPNGTANISNGSGFPGPYPYTIDGGVTGCGDNTCGFSFVLTGGPSAGASMANALLGGQSISMPTICPSGVTCNPATHSLTSPDGSTKLAINGGLGGLAPPNAWGGELQLVNGSGTWSTYKYDAVAAQMRNDGNFVVYNAKGDVVWQSNTSGHPGAFLSVSTSTVSVLMPEEWCIPRIHRCVTLDQTLWSASVSFPIIQ